MNLNNLNTISNPLISLAAMCLARLEAGEPNTEVIPKERANTAPKDYRGLENQPLTESQMVDLMGLTRGRVRDLYREYKGDCAKMLSLHGKTKTVFSRQTKFKDKDGTQMCSREISRKYKIIQDRVTYIFDKCNFDHIAAFAMLEKLEGREL